MSSLHGCRNESQGAQSLSHSHIISKNPATQLVRRLGRFGLGQFVSIAGDTALDILHLWSSMIQTYRGVIMLHSYAQRLNSEDTGPHSLCIMKERAVSWCLRKKLVPSKQSVILNDMSWNFQPFPDDKTYGNSGVTTCDPPCILSRFRDRVRD